MTDGLVIREALPADAAAVDRLYAAAFPEEDLRPLVRDLPGLGDDALLLVAMRDGALAGHVAFTRCAIAGQAEAAIALLAPVAVSPALQRQGIGGALIRAGLERLARRGLRQVNVLGDPAYYGRFGFKPDDAVLPPYPLPPEWRTAWQALRLHQGSAPLRGKLQVPPPFRRPALWGP